MQTTLELPRERWSKYMDDVTDELRNSPVTIEVTDPLCGPEIEANRLALQFLMYDRRDDVFEVSAAQGGPHLPMTLRHLVDHPTRIEVDSLGALAPTIIVVTGGDGVRTDVRIMHEGAFSG